MSIRAPLGATENGPVDVSLRASSPRAFPRPLARTRADVPGLVGLSGLVATTALVTLAAANTDSLLPESVRPIPRWLAGPFGSADLSLSSGALIAILGAMFASYVASVRAAGRLSPRSVLLCIAALNALVLLAPPLLSTDVFSYQFYGRMGAIYGANPYLAGPHAVALDPLFPYIGAKWAYTPTVYGPLFTLLSDALAPLSIAASVLAYKAIAACASLGAVALVWHAARLRGVDPVKAIALVGLNPLIFLYGVGGGHNDLLVLLPLLGGIYLLLAKRERSGGAMIVTAAALKMTAALPLAFAIANGGGRRGRPRRRELLAGAGAAAAALGALGFAVFGSGPLHILVTVHQVQSEGDWHSIPGFIGSRLGLGTVGHVTGYVLGAVFVVVLALLLRAVWRGRMDWLVASGWTAAALLLTASSLLPWYVVWLVPLAALGGDGRLWRAAIVMTGVIFGIQALGYIPHGSALGL